MAKPTQKETAAALLDRYGRTFADEIGINVEQNTPSPLFRLLCASALFSTRISADIAAEATRVLARRGWTTPEKMAASTWQERVDALGEAHYVRYDEQTSTRLEEMARLLLDRYHGDLRELREEAEQDPERERELLKEFKGIGDVGVDIFFREIQAVWREVFPFADNRALEAARRLDLPDDTRRLAKLVGETDMPRLVAALVRADLDGGYEEVLQTAQSD